MEIDHLDHIVLTVADISTTLAFYNQVLGMDIHQSEDGRFSLHFNNQKINLHQFGKEFSPNAKSNSGSCRYLFCDKDTTTQGYSGIAGT